MLTGVRWVAYSADGRQIASVSRDNSVKLWNAESLANTATLLGHADYVRCVAYRPDGHDLVTAGGDKTIRVWPANPYSIDLRLTSHGIWIRGWGQEDSTYAVDICGDLPTIATGDSVHYTYEATFIIDGLLEEGDQVRCEAWVTFSNAGERGGADASCENPQDEDDYIRGVASRVSGQVPHIQIVNDQVTMCDEICGPADPSIADVQGFSLSVDDGGRGEACNADCRDALDESSPAHTAVRVTVVKVEQFL